MLSSNADDVTTNCNLMIPNVKRLYIASFSWFLHAADVVHQRFNRKDVI